AAGGRARRIPPARGGGARPRQGPESRRGGEVLDPEGRRRGGFGGRRPREGEAAREKEALAAEGASARGGRIPLSAVVAPAEVRPGRLVRPPAASGDRPADHREVRRVRRGRRGRRVPSRP